MNELFRRVAHTTSRVMGSPWAFIIAFGVVVVWAISGWFFAFSNTWQLFINTGTTILTFLMVFLIQNTQNRDAHATHLKLDELIKAIGPADDLLIDIEDETDERINKLEADFREFKEKHANEGR